jgi:predicted RNA-binding protein YlqC (UPF0109 family)
MKDALTHIVTSIVEHPDAVKITQDEQDGITHFTISVDSADIGKVIGKEGKIIRAIRNVMKVPAIKQGKRINVALAESTPPASS